MSSFLSRLALRSLSLMPTVEPVIDPHGSTLLHESTSSTGLVEEIAEREWEGGRPTREVRTRRVMAPAGPEADGAGVQPAGAAPKLHGPGAPGADEARDGPETRSVRERSSASSQAALGLDSSLGADVSRLDGVREVRRPGMHADEPTGSDVPAVQSSTDPASLGWRAVGIPGEPTRPVGDSGDAVETSGDERIPATHSSSSRMSPPWAAAEAPRAETPNPREQGLLRKPVWHGSPALAPATSARFEPPNVAQVALGSSRARASAEPTRASLGDGVEARLLADSEAAHGAAPTDPRPLPRSAGLSSAGREAGVWADSGARPVTAAARTSHPSARPAVAADVAATVAFAARQPAARDVTPRAMAHGDRVAPPAPASRTVSSATTSSSSSSHLDLTPAGGGAPSRTGGAPAPAQSTASAWPRFDGRRAGAGETSAGASPAIKLSIGRIEVHPDVPPPAPLEASPSPAAVAPGLTLDEYLRRRSAE